MTRYGATIKHLCALTTGSEIQDVLVELKAISELKGFLTTERETNVHHKDDDNAVDYSALVPRRAIPKCELVHGLSFLTEHLSSTGDLEDVAKRCKEERLNLGSESLERVNSNEKEGSPLWDWHNKKKTP